MRDTDIAILSTRLSLCKLRAWSICRNRFRFRIWNRIQFRYVREADSFDPTSFYGFIKKQTWQFRWWFSTETYSITQQHLPLHEITGIRGVMEPADQIY